MGEKLPELRKTQRAIYSRRSRNTRPDGSHKTAIIEASAAGEVAYEEEYDQLKHAGVQPNPLSPSKEKTGKDHVTFRHQARTLDMNIIWHADYRDRRNQDFVTRSKDVMGMLLARTLKQIYTGYDDHHRLHVVGDTSRADGFVRREVANFVDTDDPTVAASVIGKICRPGKLNILVSAFNDLPLDLSRRKNGPVVGVRLNHIFEVEPQRNTGVYYTGDAKFPYVDTHDPKQLADWQREIPARVAVLSSRLGEMGVSVGNVVYEGRETDPVYGFNVAWADESIAEAVKAA